MNVVDGATFWFGMSFLSTAVILPLFVSHFTTSPLLIGLIAFLTAAGFLLVHAVQTGWLVYRFGVSAPRATLSP